VKKNILKKIREKNMSNALINNKQITNDWIVLIYGDGNNDLEPEIYNQFIKLENINQKNNIKIYAQIGRASSSIVNCFRDSYENNHKTWNGVRRYEIKSGNYTLIENLSSLYILCKFL